MVRGYSRPLAALSPQPVSAVLAQVTGIAQRDGVFFLIIPLLAAQRPVVSSRLCFDPQPGIASVPF